MKESAQAAMTYVKAHAKTFDLDKEIFEKTSNQYKFE